MARLEHLLEKSIAYSEFLASKIKKEGEGGAVAVNDGSVKGPALPQPSLVTGGQMRPYQLVRPTAAVVLLQRRASSSTAPTHQFAADGRALPCPTTRRLACIGWSAYTRTV